MGAFGAYGIIDWVRRRFDQRSAERRDAHAEGAVLTLRGVDHQVRLSDLSPAGAMIAFDGAVSQGEAVTIQLLDRGIVPGQVRWAKDGRIGISFNPPVATINGEG